MTQSGLASGNKGKAPTQVLRTLVIPQPPWLFTRTISSSKQHDSSFLLFIILLQ